VRVIVRMGRSLRRSRRGQVFSIFIFVLVLFSLLSAYFTLKNKSPSFNLEDDEKFGAKQFILTDAFHEGENILLFVDQSARLSVLSSVEELARGGGFFSW